MASDALLVRSAHITIRSATFATLHGLFLTGWLIHPLNLSGYLLK